MDARVQGHALVWMAVSRGQCECGMDFELDDDARKDRSPSSMRDMVMDAHSLHIGVISRKNKSRKETK